MNSKGGGGARDKKKQSRATEGAKQMKDREGRANREKRRTYEQKAVEASRIKDKGPGFTDGGRTTADF